MECANFLSYAKVGMYYLYQDSYANLGTKDFLGTSGQSFCLRYFQPIKSQAENQYVMIVQYIMHKPTKTMIYVMPERHTRRTRLRHRCLWI